MQVWVLKLSLSIRLSCFLTCAGQLASILDDAEKVRVEKLTLQFLNQPSSWKILSDSQKRQVLNTLSFK